MRLIKTLSILLTVLALLGCSSDKNFHDEKMFAFFERYAENTFINYPEKLSEFQVYSEDEMYAYNGLLNNVSDSFRLEMINLQIGYLDSLELLNLESASVIELQSYDILKWNLEMTRAGKAYRLYDYPINQWDGVNVSFPRFMTESHPLRNEQEARDYISRLQAFEIKVNQSLKNAKDRELLGYMPPKFICEMTIQQIEEFTNPAPVDNVLYTHFKENLEGLELNNEVEHELLHKTEELILNLIYPKYSEMLTYMYHLDSTTSEDLGVWKYPGGADYYAHALKWHTTTNLSPDEVFDIGVREALRIQNEMVELAKEMGYECESFENCRYWEDGMKMLYETKDSSLFYSDTSSAGRAKILEDYKSITERAKIGTKNLFFESTIPEIIVKETPVSSGYAGGYYAPPSFDNKRPGIFYIGLSRLPQKHGMENTTFHEGIPGHHYQASIQWQIENFPTFRKDLYYAAYMEGWAVYAERLCYEEDIFSSGHAKYQHLWSELGRAMRLIADVGIHHKKWTLDEVIANHIKYTGQGPSKSAIGRYTVYPGQACGYMIGYLKIMELREFSKAELGDKFDIREFHDVILKNGAMPLELLEINVNEYVQSKKNS